MRRWLRTVSALAALLAAPGARAVGFGHTGQAEVPVPGDLTELSGLAYAGAQIYFAVEDSDAALFDLLIDVDAHSGFIRSVSVVDGRVLEGRDDCEELVYHPSGSLFVSDESGPFVIEHDPIDGSALGGLPTPAIFRDELRANFGFEALALEPDGGGFWATTEGALLADGPLASEEAGMALRLQHWDAAGQPDRQVVYHSEPLPPGTTAVHAFGGVGVVDLEVVGEGVLLVLERTLTGLFGGEYEIYLFEVDVAGASDVSGLPSLQGGSYQPAAKTLLFRASVPDNYESMALGPPLVGGERSLLLLSEGGFGGGGPRLWAFRVDPDAPAGLSWPPEGAVLAHDFESGLGAFAADPCWDAEPAAEEPVPGHPGTNRVASAANCDGEGHLTSPPVDLRELETAILSFWRYLDDDLDGDDFLRVEVSDGGPWVELARYEGEGDDRWTLSSLDVTPYASASFRVRFTSSTNRSWEETEIDDVLITGSPVPRNPNASGGGCGLGSEWVVALALLGARRQRFRYHAGP